MKLLLLVWLAAQPGPPAQPSDDASLAEAKQHFERGKELFKSGAYDQAIVEFRAAEQIRPSPILGYNIGLAYEKLGRCKAAIAFFQRYLREQPDADNRAETEQKIADQQGKLARRECASQLQNQPPPGPGPGPGAGPGPEPGPGPAPFQPPPPDRTPPVHTENGRHPVALGVRLGPIFGGIGTEMTRSRTLSDGTVGSFENTAGFHLRAAVQFPLVMLPDGRSIVQGELFGALGAYGSSNRIMVVATGATIDTTATLLAGGFAARGNLYPSPNLPLAITPAIGLGLAAQLYHISTSDGACDISSGIPSVVLNIDLAARYELAAHHALYFSPANLYILTGGLSDGGTVDFGCFGGQSVSAESAFGTGSTQFNYNIDVGYMYQF